MQEIIAPATSVARHKVVRPRKRRVRDVLIGSVSFVILTVAASYVMLPGGQAMAMTVQDGRDPAASYQHGFKPTYRDCPVAHRGPTSRSTEVVYGSISQKKGVHVSKATVHFDGISREVAHESADVSVGASGSYRAVVHLPAGQYKVTLELSANGKHLDSSRTVRVVDNHAYDVSASVGKGRIFTLLPVSSY